LSYVIIVDESAICDSDPLDLTIQALYTDDARIGIVGFVDELAGRCDIWRNPFDSRDIGDECDEVIVDKIFCRSTSLYLSDS